MSPDIFKILTKPYADIIHILTDSLERKKQVTVDYNGGDRVIEVHAIGMSTSGNPVARVYQVSGHTEEGEPQGWKMMRLDRMQSDYIFPLSSKSSGPREGYQRNDKGMDYVFREL